MIVVLKSDPGGLDLPCPGCYPWHPWLPRTGNVAGACGVSCMSDTRWVSGPEREEKDEDVFVCRCHVRIYFGYIDYIDMYSFGFINCIYSDCMSRYILDIWGK